MKLLKMKNYLQSRALPIRLHILLVVTALSLSMISVTIGGDFGAYYTKLNSGGNFEEIARVGDYADIVVRIDADREFIFWRASSYLPHLKTPSRKEYVDEIVVRSGDGYGLRPDRVNIFSRVKIVENTPSKVVIHWRYEPNFSLSDYPVRPVNANPYDMVDEYFTITTDGHVTRTIRQGTPSIDDWNDPKYITTQEFDLTVSGIKRLKTTMAERSTSAHVISSNPETGPNVIEPVAWWKFDEGEGSTTVETISGIKSMIPGNKALWKRGVSGTALHADGYNTRITLTHENAPAVENEITIEGWISLSAYPWNDVPIVKKGDDDGYYLGVTGHGYPIFGVNSGGIWTAVSIPEELESDQKTLIDRGLYRGNLDLFTWYHLAGSYSSVDGNLRLYINGKEVATGETDSWTYVDNENKSIEYTGSWRLYRRGGFGGSFHSTEDANAKVDYKFTGTKIRVIGYTQPEGGDCQVMLNGEVKDTISYKSQERTGNIVLFEADNLGKGEHHIQLVTIGEVYPDAFAVWRDRETAPKDLRIPSDDIELAQGPPAFPVDWIHGTVASPFSLDGLLDEVRIYDIQLTPDQIEESYKNFYPGSSIINNPDSPSRSLPEATPSGKFRAYYKSLTFYENYDNFWRFSDHANVIVEFAKNPNRFIFWYGTAYIPMIVNDQNQWYCNEFNETWSTSGGVSSQEPMSEKKNLINHVRIVEQSPARVIVHWRYPLKDTKYIFANYNPKTGWGDWSDWYFTIYPDGSAFKRMRLWTDGRRNHEWHEAMVITGPGQHPQTVVDPVGVLTLANSLGETDVYHWTEGPPDDPDYDNMKIHIINFMSEWDPFTIGNFLDGDVYGGEVTPYSVFPSWNHWPIGQVSSAGRNAYATDRTAHSSFTHVEIPDYDSGPDFQEKLLLEGMTRAYTDGKMSDLVKLYLSWTQAPSVGKVSGLKSHGYNRAEGAFEFTKVGDEMSFTLESSEQNPIYNPGIVISNWQGRDTKAKIEVTGADATDIQQGIIINTDGAYSLVLWIEMESEKTTKFVIESVE
jgi:hypothetical protein